MNKYIIRWYNLPDSKKIEFLGLTGVVILLTVLLIAAIY